MRPGTGWKLRAGSSAFTRHSMTWPRIGGISSTERRSPAATRICSFTRSMPVCISVTGCSIWMLVFIAVAERGQRLAARELERAHEVVGIARDAHALPTAAGRRLDDHGEADLAGEDERLLRIFDGSRRARHDRHTDGAHGFARRRLVAHQANLLRG